LYIPLTLALLTVYNTFMAQPEDSSIRGAETCCC